MVYKQVDNRFISIRQFKILLLNKACHGASSELIHGALAEHSLPAVVNTKKQIGNDTCYRNEIYDETPRHSLCRLSVVHHHM